MTTTTAAGPGRGKGHGKGRGAAGGNGATSASSGTASTSSAAAGGTSSGAAPTTATTAAATGAGHGHGHGRALGLAKHASRDLAGPGKGHGGGGAGNTPSGVPAGPAAGGTPVATTPAASAPAPVPAIVPPSVQGLAIPVTLTMPTGIAVTGGVGSAALLGFDAAGAGRIEAATAVGASAAFTAIAPTGFALAPGAASVLGSGTTTGSQGSQGSGATDATRQRQRPRPHHSSQPSALQRIVDVIPPGLWLALAGAIAFGALMAAVAAFEGHRAGRRAAELRAVTAAALTDPLTGILNRRGFTDAVEREIARAKRYGNPFTLAYLDVRGLKRVNDSHGHQAGDRLLQEVASILSRSARRDDYVGRIGGDEMGVLLVEQSTKGAQPVIRRIRAEVAARRAGLGIDDKWDLTIGVAQYPDDADSVEGLMQVADRRLYEQRGIALR